ncbi:MAG: hypothetical protein IJ277_00350 [Bacteroidaceae bacterium]|nr:hypothetical protein [Bacteroidaceae bacterium]
MATAITTSSFSSKFNELRNIKSRIQKQVNDQLSPQEMQDVMLSRKNENTIKRLIHTGKNATMRTLMRKEHIWLQCQ